MWNHNLSEYAIIFDLDGVLVSTDELHFLAWQQLAVEIGAIGFDREDNHRQLGVSRMESLEVVLEKCPKVFDEAEKVKLADRKNGYYVSSLESLNRSSLLSGASETLDILKLYGVKIGLGSASKNAPLILSKVEIDSYFDEIACGLDIRKSKPDPEVFVTAARKLNVKPSHCIVVEDADSGVIAAKRAGMKVLGVGAAAKNTEVDWSATSLDDKNINWETILKSAFSLECL